MLRVLALVQKRPGLAPNQRFRIEQWAPHLRARHGIDVELRAFESPALTRILYDRGRVVRKGGLVVRDLLRRSAHVREARGFDVAAVLREAALLGPPLYEWWLAKRGVPIVYDFDDAIWIAPRRTSHASNDAFRFLKAAGKTRHVCRMASAVTVGNEYLAAWARQFNREVHVVPTSIDLAAYPVQPPPERDDPFTIVWSGTFSTLEHLEHVRGALEKLARRRAVRLDVVCDRPLARPVDGVDTRFVPWRADAEARLIGAAHVGIMPLPDDELTRGKCGCKALQYMAAGRVAVVSPVGVNADIVRHRENGFLASSEDEWVDVLDELARSRSLREQVAARGRETVERRYSAERSAELFAGAVRVAVAERRAPPSRRPDPHHDRC